MSRAPLVSVIIPVYERRFCVMDAVKSVLAQTHSPVECVVVDDGSTDGTVDVLTAASAGEPRLRVFTQAHGGVSAARNRGLREARGEFVTFLDSDDLMPSDRIRRQLELLTERSCDAVMGTMEIAPETSASMPAFLDARPDWQDGYYWTSILLEGERLRSVGGFDESVHLGEDIDVLVKLSAAGLRIAAVDEPFVIRRFFGDNLSYVVSEHDSALRDAVRRHVARRRRIG